MGEDSNVAAIPTRLQAGAAEGNILNSNNYDEITLNYGTSKINAFHITLYVELNFVSVRSILDKILTG